VERGRKQDVPVVKSHLHTEPGFRWEIGGEQVVHWHARYSTIARLDRSREIGRLGHDEGPAAMGCLLEEHDGRHVQDLGRETVP
jgi:hypothetical protein